MDEYKEDDLREMEFLPPNENINIDVVLLRDLEERKRLYDAFKTGKRGNKSSKNVDWGKEESLNPDGLKCNFNINHFSMLFTAIASLLNFIPFFISSTPISINSSSTSTVSS